jgi:hypothetical protein
MQKLSLLSINYRTTCPLACKAKGKHAFCSFLMQCKSGRKGKTPVLEANVNSLFIKNDIIIFHGFKVEI